MEAVLALHFGYGTACAQDAGELSQKEFTHAALCGIDYERVTRSFFAISVEPQGTVHYSHCNFASDDGGTVYCIDLVYPQDVARAWDGIVTRISRSLRPLEG